MIDSHKYSKSIKDRRTGKLKHLPPHYAKNLRIRLLEAGYDYKVSTIWAVINKRRSNNIILAEALKMADECLKMEKQAGMA
ncbi:MAG: hypothetical protein Q8J69_07600 [Sphingobacteriaceae bacterium]|nr:hypothetical protein [Sphingobacteriaceae bacterium]